MKAKFIKFYGEVCESVARLSNCDRLKVGAVIVKDDNIIGYGYNGTPRGYSNCCENENGETLPEVLHAEENALLKVARSTMSAKGAAIFCTHFPCDKCSRMIIQAGIEEIYFKYPYGDNKATELYIYYQIKVRQWL